MPVQLLPVAPQTPRERLIADCRIYERRRCALPTTLQPASALEMKEMRWAATIADISQGGVRLLLQRRFEKGAGLALELPGDGERESSIVFVKVVHLRAEGPGTWALGCRFVSELSEDELQRLLTSTNHVLSSSKQEYLDNQDEVAEPATEVLRPVTPAKRFLTDVHVRIDTQDGKSVNCVIRRLNVSRSWPLTSGKILTLNGKSSNLESWSLRIQVRETRELGKGWEIEGRILGPMNAADIKRSFG